MVEQPLLAEKATGVAGKRAVRADDAMTRHNNGNGIRPIGGAYRAACFDVAKVCGELPIGDRGASGNVS